MIETDHPIALAVTLTLVIAAIAGLELGLFVPGSGGNATTPVPADAGGQPAETSTLVTDEGRLVAERAYETVPDRIERKRGNYSRAIEIQQPTGFLNADRVNLSQYVGEKVVLIEFWTFGCYNCRNSHPYIQEYWREYEDDGLVVIGVHYPEFEYEKDPENIREYLDETNTTYPVVIDNAGGTWDAYDQRAWPTRYLIGVDGFIRYKKRGEGGYEETDRKIQELLAERDRVVNETDR